MKTLHTLTLWLDDMGTFHQPGCTDAADALWHVNHAREHDGLAPITLDKLRDMLDSPANNCARATLKPEN